MNERLSEYTDTILTRKLIIPTVSVVSLFLSFSLVLITSEASIGEVFMGPVPERTNLRPVLVELMKHCGKLVYNCLRFSNDGIGFIGGQSHYTRNGSPKVT